MNREIKFRAWDEIDNRMHIVEQLSPSNWIAVGVQISEDEAELQQRRLEDVVLMQYTGLKDAKGVEIYEGDVVMVPNVNHDPSNGDSPSDIFEVEWVDGAFVTQKFILREYEQEYTEVIGNVWEHPHLIQKENDSK